MSTRCCGAAAPTERLRPAARAETSEQTIRAFLAKGFAGEAITVSAPRVNDRDAQGMVDRTGNLARYTAEVTVTLRTGKPVLLSLLAVLDV